MEAPLQAWVHNFRRSNVRFYPLTESIVDLGGSLAVASRGLYATGVSTDLNGKPMPDSTPTRNQV